MTREYLLGICYTCQKCLICFTSKDCECEKNIKPTRVSKPQRGQQIYSRVFTPNKELQAANQFLISANEKFQYNSNFDKSFSFTFCSACNSKFQRLKAKDKKNKSKKEETFPKEKEKLTKKLDESIAKMDSKSSNIIDVDAEVEEDDDDSSEFSEVEEYGIDEIKLQIIIEKQDKKTSTSKTIIIKPVEYANVIEKINDAVQKALKNKNIKPSNYSMSYKAINARGPSNALEDKLDFNEFINDYKKIIATNKKMAVIVVIGSDSANEKLKSKRSKVKKFFNTSILIIFFIFFISNLTYKFQISDESDLSAFEEEEILSNSKTKKKSRPIQENDLSKEDKTRAETIAILCEKYKCNLHITPCFIQENRHLQLNPARLQLWAREIVSKLNLFQTKNQFYFLLYNFNYTNFM